MHTKMGELLGEMAQISAHDISEILVEQQNNGKRFGDIALSWGLCQPKHVWRAWAQQAAMGQMTVDVLAMGVDTQAVGLLPRDKAEAWGMIPLRTIDNEVVIATADVNAASNTAVQETLQRKCRFVLADSQQIQQAINKYYPTA